MKLAFSSPVNGLTPQTRSGRFVSANVHRSLHGTKVVNYAQWRRVSDLEAAMLRNSIAQEQMQAATQLAIQYGAGPP